MFGHGRDSNALALEVSNRTHALVGEELKARRRVSQPSTDEWFTRIDVRKPTLAPYGR